MDKGTKNESTQGRDKIVSLNVRLLPAANSDQPLSANHTRVGMVQGIAYLDFGFIEPAVLAEVARNAQNGGTVPKNLEGKLVTRVALPLEAIARLHQQLRQVLVGLRGRQASKQ